MKASSESGLCATRISIPLPDLSQKIVPGYIHEHCLPRIAQTVVNEAHVRAPALIALDLLRFLRARRRLPEDLELHVYLSQIRDGLPHLAGANASVEINHRRSRSGCAGHTPLAVTFKVCELCPVMKRESSHVGHSLDPSKERIAILDEPMRVSCLQVG